MRILKLSAKNQVAMRITTESRKYNKIRNIGMWNILNKINNTKLKYIWTFFDFAGI
jgi:hypothetical protein